MNLPFTFLKRSLALLITLLIGMGMGWAQPQGVINGVFSVAPNTFVYFSQGNLQYIGSASAPYWKFADHQWDYLGTTTGQNSGNQNVDRDLFGWGTSGYNHGANCYQPWSTSQTNIDYYAYGNVSYNLFGQTGQADWGYNAISNGGNQENIGWRTLTTQEWQYLFNTRSTPSGIRYAKAKVNNVNGVILLPDDWNASYYTLNSTNSSGASYSSNTITAAQWASLEQYGAAFLPAAVYRYGTLVYGAGHGDYWSSSYSNSNNAWGVYFDDVYLDASYELYYGQCYGLSVRLVFPFQCLSFAVNASPSPVEGGSVSGAGAYQGGAECTLTATASAGYVFHNWTENGAVVSTYASYTFVVSRDRNLVANFMPTTSEGGTNGVFSVNGNGGSVVFSQGNLQYIGSAETPYWKFAEHQWDYLGTTTGQNSGNQNVDRDLFGWGTSGYNHGANCYQPWSTSQTNIDYYAYGNVSYNLFGQTGQADWGYNAISNGGNQENIGWRTLTTQEWQYLFNTRSTPSGIRYAKAKVNNVNGVILLPDDWNASYYTLNSTNSSGASYTTNTITETQWASLEQFGAVFLPAAGYRYGTSVINADSYGYYWSSSYYSSYSAWLVSFRDSNLRAGSDGSRSYGLSVRLVFPSQGYSFAVNASPSPVEGGAVSGTGAYSWGTECTLTATASEGYAFYNWSENGVVVSTDATYTFVVLRERNLVANFVAEGNINFADANVKAICVANWDVNGDGELSYGEAANVTSLGNVFKNNTNIHSFNELQYFISLGTIGEQAFYGCTELTQITIPEPVTSVGSKAFWNCPALQTVNYNAINCTSMQTSYNSNTYSVFSSNGSGSVPALKRVVIGSGVQRIPDYAFKDGVDIYPGVTIRSSVTEIGAHAFENCSSITTLSFQNNSNLSSIGESAFRGCSALNRALNLPNSLVTLGQYAFYGCTAIPSLTLGTSLETIGGYAFWNCPNLATVNFNATNCTSMVTNSQYSVFNSSTNNGGATPIVTLNIGNNVTYIPDFAFRNSPSITHTITIPDATTYIGPYAFHSIQSAELTIGTGVATIGGYAFWNCPNLATVNFNATNCTSMVTNSQYSVFNSGTNNGGATPIVTLNIGNNVTSIPDFAFRNSPSITNAITIPNVTTYIGQYAFHGIQSSELTIGTGVATIGGFAFWNCPNLVTVNFNATNCTSMVTNSQYSVFNSGTNNGGATPIVTLTIGENVTNIPDYAFRNSSLATGNLLLPSGLTNIGQYAFDGCSGFTGNLTLPNSVASIGQYAFNGCSGFNGTLTLPVNESVTTINQYTFNGCSGLTGTLTIPANVTEVANSAFQGCSSFTGPLVLHDAMTTIGGYAFYGCSGIPELTIGQGISTIGAYAYWNCPALATVHFNATNCTSMVTNSQYSVFNSGTSNGGATPIVTLTIGNAVTNIPNYAFRNSSNLANKLVIPNSVTNIGQYAFAGSSGQSRTLLLGNALANIGQYAFQGCSGFTGDLVIPHAVTTIGQYAFQNCSGFDGSLTVGRGIQTINQYTFANCSGFSGALILGTQVNNIANNAFQNCSAFALVISENPNPIAATSSSFTGMNYSIPVYVPDGLVANYQNSTGWSNFTNYIEQFTFWDNLDSANWSDEMNWLSMELPTENDVVCITYNCDLDIDYDVLYVYIYNINDVLTIKSNQTLYTTYGVGLMSPSQLVIEQGGQVIYGNEANSNVTQTLDLSAGWNWVSINVEVTMDDLKEAVVAAEPGASPTIKSKGNGQTAFNGVMWMGALKTIDLSQMYEIKVANACTVNLEGTRVNPADHPATIKKGANWIAYPLDETKSVANAFAGFPVTGDNVKSKDGGQATWNGVMWLGALKNLVPGAGYIYNSKATENKTLTF